MSIFNLEKSSKIWIFGYGNPGIDICNKLRERGYHVEGFIDRKAERYLQNKRTACQICTLEDFVKIPQVDKKIVFVSLYNGRQQEMMAYKLFTSGCSKIIYLPMNGGGSLKKRSVRRQIYQTFRQGDFEEVKEVPVYCETDHEDLFDGNDKDVIVSQSNYSLEFWCPVSMLRTARQEFFHFSDKTAESEKEWMLSRYADIELKHMTPYINLFHWLQGDMAADVMSYCKLVERTQHDECRVLLEDRKELMKIYEAAYRYEMEFFMDSPAVCKWNANGYFNVVDGLHRIFFLISKGRDEVPIEVGLDDWAKYKKWKNSGYRCVYM